LPVFKTASFSSSNFGPAGNLSGLKLNRVGLIAKRLKFGGDFASFGSPPCVLASGGNATLPTMNAVTKIATRKRRIRAF
jgi:hypothetical protein